MAFLTWRERHVSRPSARWCRHAVSDGDRTCDSVHGHDHHFVRSQICRKRMGAAWIRVEAVGVWAILPDLNWAGVSCRARTGQRCRHSWQQRAVGCSAEYRQLAREVVRCGQRQQYTDQIDVLKLRGVGSIARRPSQRRRRSDSEYARQADCSTAVDVSFVTRGDGDEARALSSGRHLIRKPQGTVLAEGVCFDHAVHNLVREVNCVLCAAVSRVGRVGADVRAGGAAHQGERTSGSIERGDISARSVARGVTCINAVGTDDKVRRRRRRRRGQAATAPAGGDRARRAQRERRQTALREHGL